MAPWLAKELLFALSLMSLPQFNYVPTTQNLTREESVRDPVYKVLREDQIDEKEWVRFDLGRINQGIRAVPPLNLYQWSLVRGWSCGPDSIAYVLSVWLAGKPAFTSSVDYTRFALGVPKALGAYADHDFDDSMTYNTFWFDYAYIPLRMWNVPFYFQSAMSSIGAKTGGFPKWLVEYMNAYSVGKPLLKDMNFTFFSTDDYQEMRTQIISHLNQGGSVIPLIAFSATEWHYLNIVGYSRHTQQWLVLDGPNVYKWSGQRMKGLMYMGFNSVFHPADEAFSVAIRALANQFSPVDDYSAIFVARKRPIDSE